MKKRFLQTDFWASFKSNHGWKKVENKSGISIMVRELSLKIKKISIAYVPMYPEFESNTQPENLVTKLSQVAEEIKDCLPPNTFCIRFDPAMDIESDDERNDFVRKTRSVKTNPKVKANRIAVQPPDTVLVPLTLSQEGILSQMKNKWRYNIKLAAKKGVQVEKWAFGMEGFEKAFDIFYSLFQQTSQRDGVQFHAKEYYLDLLERGSNPECDQPYVQLYLAKHENDYLAGIITLFCSREAVYLYGASGNIKRNLMPAYLLQWTAMQDAKEFGCPVYDFYGCPPTDDPKHPMHGLFLFKTGFGGKLVHRPGSFDVVLNRGDYSLYQKAERLRAWYYRVFRKKLAGR